MEIDSYSLLTVVTGSNLIRGSAVYLQVRVFNVGQRRTGQVAESTHTVSRVAHVKRLTPVVDAQTLLAASL